MSLTWSAQVSWWEIYFRFSSSIFLVSFPAFGQWWQPTCNNQLSPQQLTGQHWSPINMSTSANFENPRLSNYKGAHIHVVSTWGEKVKKFLKILPWVKKWAPVYPVAAFSAMACWDVLRASSLPKTLLLGPTSSWNVPNVSFTHFSLFIYFVIFLKYNSGFL